MKLKNPIKNSMMLQIIFFYLFGNILFIVLLSSIFYYTSRYIIMKKEMEYNRENASDAARYISLYVDKLKNIINLMSIDADVRSFLKNGNENSVNNIGVMMDLIHENDDNIKSITIIGKNGNIISSDKNIVFDVSDDMLKEAWYVDALNNSDVPVFNPSRKNNTYMNSILWVLSISHDIKDQKGENLGVIVFDVKYEVLNEYLKTLFAGEKGDSLIVDDKNQIIYYKDADCFINRKCLDKFSTGSSLPEDRKNSIIKVDIEETNWKLITISSMDDLLKLKKSFNYMVLSIFLVSLFFTSIVAFSAITKLLRPLVKLEKHIQKFENSLDEFNLEENVSYEIEILIGYFNEMVKKIKYLREYEIQALHSQINPHFLYNTLDTIIWMAEFEDSEKVIALTKSLANFFRLSLSNGHEMISLDNEVTHVKEYLFIQKQRYEDKLSYFFNIEDESLLLVKVPKIIIQPIVENSIYHGIKNIPDTGIISINIYSENDSLIISVTDNGPGFSESHKYLKNKTGGVGIKNVDKRIKFYYGEEYGVYTKETVEGQRGATVIIKLPLNLQLSH